jgi:hypothetical protein
MTHKGDAMKTYRQGDVLVIEVRDVPQDTTEVPRENGRIILAHGEVTGHSHAIASPDAVLLSFGGERGMERYLRALRPVELRHEEHAKIDLPAGNYRVVIQREYRPEGIVNVAD